MALVLEEAVVVLFQAALLVYHHYERYLGGVYWVAYSAFIAV